MKPINRKNRFIEKYEMFELVSTIAGKNNLKSFNEDNKSKIISCIKDLFDSINNPILLYGKQTENMFSFMASCLPRCVLIKQEDTGSLFSNDTVKLPDFRVLLKNNEQLLIEVKNCHFNTKIKKFQIKTKELQELNRYAELMRVKLKIAIYWSNIATWTLVDTDKFTNRANNSFIDIKTAMINNEMSLLGDYMLATIPPLELKLHFKEDTMSPNLVNGVVDKVELYANKNLIKNELEREIAFNLILFGNWQDELLVEYDVNSRCIVSVSKPIEPSSNNQISIIGSLSSIISKKFKYYTNYEKGTIPVFSDVESRNLFINVNPDNYKGDVLQLWRFEIVTRCSS